MNLYLTFLNIKNMKYTVYSYNNVHSIQVRYLSLFWHGSIVYCDTISYLMCYSASIIVWFLYIYIIRQTSWEVKFTKNKRKEEKTSTIHWYCFCLFPICILRTKTKADSKSIRLFSKAQILWDKIRILIPIRLFNLSYNY